MIIKLQYFINFQLISDPFSSEFCVCPLSFLFLTIYPVRLLRRLRSNILLRLLSILTLPALTF